jgi:hypothetical protein
MNMIRRHSRTCIRFYPRSSAVSAVLLFMTLCCPWSAAQEPIHLGKLVYGQNQTASCFSERFLSLINQVEGASLAVDDRLHTVFADSPTLTPERYPAVVMSGDGPFTLKPEQSDNLRRYIEASGFLIVSAGCSSQRWNQSFERALKDWLPGATLETLPSDHAVYVGPMQVGMTWFSDVLGERLPVLRSVHWQGKLAAVWCPDGLNETGIAGGSCCCCGGEEAQSAGELLTNLLVWRWQNSQDR